MSITRNLGTGGRQVHGSTHAGVPGPRRPCSGDSVLAAGKVGASAGVTNTRLDFLDGIRGLAAFYVLLHHVWLTSYSSIAADPRCRLCLDSPAWASWLTWGHVAVSIFFVVSGFSLALGAVRSGDRLPDSYADYLLRRGYRILPPYWAALAISCLVIVLVTGEYSGATVNLKAVVVHAALVQNVIDSPKPNGAFWSIAIEWQIYFVLPVLLLMLRRLGRVGMLVALTACASLLYLAGSDIERLSRLTGVDALWLVPFEKLLHLGPQFLALFAFGVVAAHVSFARRPNSRESFAVGLALLAGTAVLFRTLSTAYIDSHYFWIDIAVGATTASLCASFAQRPSGWMARALGSRWLRWLGQSSYSLYLVHVPVLEAIYFTSIAPLSLERNERFLVLCALVVPAALLFSRLFWHVFERPFMSRRSFVRWREQLARARMRFPIVRG